MIGGDYQIRYRVPTSGTFSIERNTEDFRVSYMDGSTQKTLYQHEYNFAEPLYLYIFTSSENESSWQVALDNLSYTAHLEPGSVTSEATALPSVSTVAATYLVDHIAGIANCRQGFATTLVGRIADKSRAGRSF
jgi:hypothetical protein